MFFLSVFSLNFVFKTTDNGYLAVRRVFAVFFYVAKINYEQARKKHDFFTAEKRPIQK